MAPFSINAITFIPGKEFVFGSFTFITGVDGRLHVSNLETTRTGQIRSDSASHNITRSSSESDSDRLEKGITLPRYLFGFCNSANTYQYMLCQIMEPRPEHETYWGKGQGQVDDVIHPADDEFQVVNVILHPFGQQDHGEGSSLHRVINSLTHSESSSGSWDPVRELYAIAGGVAPTEEELKR